MFQPGDQNQTQLTTSYQIQYQIFFFITDAAFIRVWVQEVCQVE